VIWPEEEGRWAELCETAARAGARTFVLNQPWQAAFFESFAGKLELWAGPYCNIANPLALGLLKDSGFSGAFPSQELGREEFLALPGMSPLPLGIVTKGLWPLGLSRAPAEHFRQSLPLESPMGEICYARDLGGTTWIYPNWPLDLSGEEPLLAEAGYQVFVHLQEPPAKAVPRADRASTFNWDLQLL
jgi:putative protease